MKHALTLGDSGMSRHHESVFGARFSLAGSGAKFEKKVVEQQCAAAIEDNATVVTALEAWGERLQSPVWLIIDDLDRMARIEERRGFLTLFKQLADRACPVKMILVARGEQPEGVFGAGAAFTCHLSPVKLAPLTLKNGYEFISLCLVSFGLLMVERLKWRMAQACAGHPRKQHQVYEHLLISAWERGGRHITPQQCQYALQCVRCVGPAPAGAGGHDASQSGDAPLACPEDV